jgi:alanine-synthesizing transaminase
MEALREAIVVSEREKNGISIAPADVIITNGVSEGIQVLMGAIIEPKDEILVPGPGYSSYTEYIKFFGGTPRPYRMDESKGWAPDVDDIRRNITDRTKAIVLINPNNPTGAVYSERTLREVADLAGEQDLLIISDEIYDMMTYGAEFTSISRIAPDVNRILLNGFSKVNLVPGWRLGYGVFMSQNGELDDLKEGVLRQLRIRLCANAPCQKAAIAALQGPQDHLLETNRKLKERGEYSTKRLNEIEGISVVEPKGAFYMFPRYEGKWKDDYEFVYDLLKEEHVLFVPGEGFCSVYGRSHFRAVTLPPMETLEVAYDRLDAFMRRHRADQ